MTATIDKTANTITFTMPLQPARTSATGKTKLVATHSGAINAVVDGQPLKATVSVYYKP